MVETAIKLCGGSVRVEFVGLISAFDLVVNLLVHRQLAMEPSTVISLLSFVGRHLTSVWLWGKPLIDFVKDNGEKRVFDLVLMVSVERALVITLMAKAVLMKIAAPMNLNCWEDILETYFKVECSDSEQVSSCVNKA